MIPRDTSALTYELFEIRAVERAKFCFKIRVTFEIRATATCETFSELIEANGYIPQQVFNCDETGLFWKKMPNRTYITAEEKIMPGHKPMKDRLTLALCANASGDCKIKPLLVYHSENPRAFKSHKILKEKLQVMWRANRRHGSLGSSLCSG